jgi:SAM-dependent methyltransferase
MKRTLSSKAWYERLAEMQAGYYYPWTSQVAPFNGEDVYLDMVHQYLAPDKDVLDVGCGHGEVALDIAPLCRSVLAYDRVARYIELARKGARKRGVRNVTFVCADSHPDAHGGHAQIPADDDSLDLMISRRGPINWMEDARRVARPGAVLLQLNPMDSPYGNPIWNEELPEPLRIETHEWSMRGLIEERLAKGGLQLHSCWTFDVPEVFAQPEQLYVMLSWGYMPDEVPSWEETRAIIQRIFREYAGPEGLAIRFRRFLWQAIVD